MGPGSAAHRFALHRVRDTRPTKEHAMNYMNVDYSTKIPNNVNLSEDRQVLKALEGWHPGYMDWWSDMGPEGFQQSLVYLRTAYSVDPRGWAKFDYVKMPEYRWGILLAPQEENRVIPFGENFGKPAWQEVPGEHRATLRRLIVIQGDTEPASVEQQRHLGKTAPSLYDLRNLFQVNVEEGRHLWAMVYLLQKYFGRDGREEADDLLRRRSGDADSPRMLDAFNAGIKGRYKQTQIEDDHQLKSATYPVLKLVDGVIKRVDEPALTALNMRLRDDYTQDCVKGMLRWNKIISLAGFHFKLTLPNVAFHRQIGEFRDIHATPEGVLIDDATWNKRNADRLPSTDDGDFIASLMEPVTEAGQYASWISPPKVGIDNKPGDFEYVKIDT